MRKEGMCMICNVRIGSYTCSACGRFVCKTDFDFGRGVCRGCLRRQ